LPQEPKRPARAPIWQKAAYCGIARAILFFPFWTNFPLGQPGPMLSPLDFTGWANQEITPICTHISGICFFFRISGIWVFLQKKNSGIWEGHKNGEYETNTNMHHRAMNNAWHSHALRTYASTIEYLFL
jgi:hypothetical protein